MHDALSLAAAARDAADATALISGAERLSFKQLAAAVADKRIAIGKQTRPRIVPLIGANTLDAIVELLAHMEARVPVLLLHPKATAAEHAAEIAAATSASDTLPVEAAVIVFTSGTTGQPRGAVLARSAFVASARASAANLGWQDDDRWLLAMPIARVGGLSILTRCIVARRTVVLAPAFDAAALPQWIDSWRATLVSLVPTMALQVFERHPDWQPPAWLRALVIGGAAASPRLLRDAANRHAPIVLTYGCTETCSQVVATPYSSRFNPAECGVGRPLPGAAVRVVDERIEVRGPMLMTGYLGEPPLDPQAWFDTGDLGAFDSAGFLHLHARRGDLIISGGENVYPAEVERVLESCPGIRAAAVFGVPDETWGQVVAAVLVAAAAIPDSEAVAEFVGAQLARHKRPRQIAFVERLPLTPAGKLDRAALSSLTDLLRPLVMATARD